MPFRDRLRQFVRVLRRPELLIALAVTLLGVVAFFDAGPEARSPRIFALLQNLELRSLDLRFQLRGVRPHDPHISIVGLDETTLHRMGTFPIPRNAYASLIERLSASGARIIVFDETFPTPEKNSAVEALKELQAEIGPNAGPKIVERFRSAEGKKDNDAILAAAMAKAGNVILGHIFLSRERAAETDSKAAEAYYNTLWGQPFPQIVKVKHKGEDFQIPQAWEQGKGQIAWGIEPNIPVLADVAKSYGFINANADFDGTFRRATLLIRYQDLDYFPSLAFQAVKQYEGIPDQQVAGYMGAAGLERIDLGPHRIATAPDGTISINYAGPYNTFPHYSMIDVIDGRVPGSAFRDGLVLVGPTALGIGDIRNTPFQEDTAFMGVEIQANIMDNLLHAGEPGRSYLKRGPNQEAIDLAFIVAFGLVMGYVFSRVRPLLAMASVLLALALFSLFVDQAFLRWDMWLSFAIPAATLLLDYAGITTYRMVFEEREKRRIRRSFSQYVSPKVIQLIEREPAKYLSPGGEMKDLTVMFSDIRSFTTISEALTPNELVLLLNEYLGEMTSIIFHRLGTLDKYIGDAIMAFWGSPVPQEDHAHRACAAAIEMQRRLRDLNKKWAEQGRKQLAIGVGVNTGPMSVGNMGSPQRLAWTVMGDNVNLASRLEGINKHYHTGIVISEFTRQQVGGGFVARELDRIRVKGKLHPVGIYELLDFANGASKYDDLLVRFADALCAYRSQCWHQAIEKLEQLLVTYPDDGPSKEFLRRCHEYLEHPPAAGWDGVYVMETK
ncbi:MAG: CHASE2 domain-containing protein [Terriglobales bacterium]